MSDQWIVVDDVTIDDPFFVAYDLDLLLSGATRGENDLIPGVAGTITNPIRPTQIDEAVTWLARGSSAVDLHERLAYYRAALYDDPDPSTGCKAAVLHTGGESYEADIQVRTWDLARTGPVTATVLTRIIVPSGRFTLTEGS